MQVIGEKGEKFMKKHKVKYTDEPIGKIKIVEDFLPQPKDLILKDFKWMPEDRPTLQKILN